MGKASKYPAYSGGAVNINGFNVAKTSKKGNSVNSDYYMNKTQKKIYNSVQNNMADVLANLFEISSPQRQEWNNQLSAMKNVGMANINDIYTPIQNNLKNDIASRFGNLDNSVFLDKLNAITTNKSKAVADLANNLALAQSDLYNQEIQNRINMLSLLDSLNNSINSNILSYLGLANQNANSGNQYNQARYQATASQGNMLGQIAKLGATALATYYGGPAGGALASSAMSKI